MGKNFLKNGFSKDWNQRILLFWPINIYLTVYPFIFFSSDEQCFEYIPGNVSPTSNSVSWHFFNLIKWSWIYKSVIITSVL